MRLRGTRTGRALVSVAAAAALGLGWPRPLAGCRSVDEPSPAEIGLSYPERFVAAETAETPGIGGEPSSARDSWTGFEDERLLAAVVEALAHNRSLFAAAARVRAAQAQARIAGADRLPAVQGSASAGRRKQVFVGLPLPGGGVLESTSTSYGVSLDVGWELDLWGRLAAAHGAARAELEGSEADRRAARLSIAGQTAKGFFAWQEARLQEELARRTLASFEETRRLVQDRFRSGSVGALDVSLATADLESARARLERRSQARERIVRQLELLLGRYPSGNLRAGRLGADEPEDEAALPAVPPPPPPGLPAELLLHRPDLAASGARLRAAESRAAESRAALFPRIALTAGPGLVSDELSDVVGGDFGVWSLAANLTQPIFQGGRLRAGVERSRARVDEARHEFALLALAAFAEVETALALEGELEREEEASGLAATEAGRAGELAHGRYRAGRESLITVLEARRRAVDAESRLLDVRRRRLETRVDLFLALGMDPVPAPAPADE